MNSILQNLLKLQALDFSEATTKATVTITAAAIQISRLRLSATRITSNRKPEAAGDGSASSS